MSISIDGVTSYDSLSEAASAAAAGSDELDREAFLNLLVAQLQNQDPMEPQANSEFVAQLAQFSSLEQLTNANDALGSLYTALASMNNASMTQLLGAQVTASGDTFYYGGSGEQTVYYDIDSDASSATITITDADGSVVCSEELGALEQGEGSYTWDGTDQSGDTVDEGEYSFSISATDSHGDDVDVETMVKGEIDGMSYDTGTPVPSIDGVDISLGDIIEVYTTDDESVDSDSDTETTDTEAKDGDGVEVPDDSDSD